MGNLCVGRECLIRAKTIEGGGKGRLKAVGGGGAMGSGRCGVTCSVKKKSLFCRFRSGTNLKTEFI